MEDIILRINTHRTDLKSEFTAIGINVSSWDIRNEHFENSQVVISWIGDYPFKERGLQNNPHTGFTFALIRFKGEGQLDLKNSNKLAKFNEEAVPLRVFL